MIGVKNYRKYLDPQVLANINGLELRARLAVEGYVSGSHRSPYQGMSVEYADHRVYAHGDDIRHVDWKRFARTDKHYIKQYHQETNLNCVVAVDTSESMSYRSPNTKLSKHEYASCVAASLSYLALRHRDAVGLVRFDEKIIDFVKPTSNPGTWRTMVQLLDQGPGVAKTGLRRVLGELAERLNRRTLIILISDLLDDGNETLLGLRHLRYLNNDIIVCNIWDPAELRFGFQGQIEFSGLEGMGRLMADPRSLQSHYVQEVERFITRMRRGCRSMQIDYVAFDTSSKLDAAIGGYLGARSARIRLRSSRVLGAG